MILQRMKIEGKRCVAIEETEFRRLERLARSVENAPLPPFPPADARGNVPAFDYMQASIARDIIKERRSLGLSQLQLAELAGLRQETLSRLESGKHSPTVRTVDKIDQALKRYAKSRSKRRRTK